MFFKGGDHGQEGGHEDLCIKPSLLEIPVQRQDKNLQSIVASGRAKQQFFCRRKRRSANMNALLMQCYQIRASFLFKIFRDLFTLTKTEKFAKI